MNRRIQYQRLLMAGLAYAFITGCGPKNKTTQAVDAGYYTETHRPQFHFSPEANWMNDPNGMVYYEGEYHLFYQYYPDSTVWGPMHWGHAVSKDMINWEHLPVGLYPDELGYIFSGSAVIDWHNTSGFGAGERPPMVAIFTHHLAEGEEAGRTDYQNQSIAYSRDKGRTWTKYEENPVLPNQGIKDFRDPKVFWHEASGQWVMILAVWDHIELYGSPDLKAWEKLSDFGLEAGNHGGVWECPDLFELPVEGTETSKWVMIVSIGSGGPNKGSATQYFIGDFDGKTFLNDNAQDTELWVDHGPDNYAGVTWSDVPATDGRRLFMGWMSNWQYAQVVPTREWRSAMTLPRQLKLRTLDQGTILFSEPVEEVGHLRVSSQDLEPTTVSGLVPLETTSNLNEMELVFEDYGQAEELGMILASDMGSRLTVGFDPASNEFFIDRTASGKTAFHEGFGARAIAPRTSNTQQLTLRIFVDTSSIELFADNGGNVLTSLVFSRSDFNQFSLYCRGGSAELVSGKLHSLKRIW